MKSEASHSEYQIHEFPNGIRLIHKQVFGTKIVHCGYILDVGSRDEDSDHQGIAHFWEHLAFKGTQKRKAFHILNRLEILGGELNAYTTKEKIAFHASILADHYTKAVDLLTDITFFSTFPRKELEREKGVILEEMAMYRDSPDDAIQDDFDSMLFPDHPLGRNILGTETSIPTFGQADFHEFYNNQVSTDRLIFSVVGPFDFKTAIRKAAPFIEMAPKVESQRSRFAPPELIPKIEEISKPITQAHLMMGWRAFPLLDSNRIPMFVLNNILGGPALNSRLNMIIREKNGLAYSVESNYSPFLDSGAFFIYLGTEYKNLNKASGLVWKELQKIKTTPLTGMQLHNAKEQIKGQLAMAEEGNLSLMLMLGKSILDQGRVESLGEIFGAIDLLKSHDLMEVAQHILTDQFCQLSFVPESKSSGKIKA